MKMTTSTTCTLFWIRLVVWGGLGLAAFRVSAATYYVATNGIDTNPGSLLSPWRTIAKASGILLPGDTVLVRGGVYGERITVGVSGSAATGFVTYRLSRRNGGAGWHEFGRLGRG